MTINFTKHETVSLRKLPDFSESWLHDLICDDPSILRLGDVDVLDRERTQEAGGRLDLILSDSEKTRRYEVEIMLGATDPSHIIRCIEYWDIERRRYPAYDHVAVLIAENITARFLNVIGLLSGTIPVVAIQMNAIKVGEKLVLNFVHVLNQTALRRDDPAENGGRDTDRAYWESRVGSEIMSVCDSVLEMINEKAIPKQNLNYKKRHIGLKSGGSKRNFVYFGPKKKFIRIAALVSNVDEWLERLENEGIPADRKRTGVIRVTTKPKDFQQHKDLIRELIHQAVEEYQA